MSQFKFSVGPWNVHPGADSYGPETRKDIPIEEKFKKFAELGFSAVQFHDDDAVPALEPHGAVKSGADGGAGRFGVAFARGYNIDVQNMSGLAGAFDDFKARAGQAADNGVAEDGGRFVGVARVHIDGSGNAGASLGLQRAGLNNLHGRRRMRANAGAAEDAQQKHGPAERCTKWFCHGKLLGTDCPSLPPSGRGRVR